MNSIRRKLIGLFPKIAGSYITISTPHSGAQITIGSTLSITGLTDFADGSIVSIYAGATLLGTTIVSSGAFSYSWTADGEPGSLTLKAVCGDVESSVTVTLIEPQPKLSIESTVSADTPSDYIHDGGDVSITSTVSADTPTNI